MMAPSDEIWQIIERNEPILDGKVWYAVKTTKIFCKPSCSSRLPNRKNVVLYDSPEQAMADGYRPCKRCRPMDEMVADNTWVDEINYILEKHYAEKLTLEELAYRVHGSASYLRHVYKRETGITPQKKLMMIRISKAEQDLINSKRPVSNIGNEVGVPNTAYFIKMFKKEYGCSPYQYRLAHDRS